MTETTALDPEISAYLAQIQSITQSAHKLTAIELRKTFDALRIDPGVQTKVAEIHDLVIPSADGGIKARLYKAESLNDQPLLVWYHGGGWVLGDLDTAELTCRDLASESGCHVLSVDYRLAPEHPFPAAYDDAVASLRYAFDHAAELGVDASQIAIGGDSAGANLAACACIAAKAQDLKVIYQLLIYPVVEANFDNTSYQENANDYFLTRNLMKWFWDHYVPEESKRSDPRVVPLNNDLKGLPPAWLLTVQFDPLRDEGVKYATALQQAGVPVVTTHSSDTIHGFFTTPTSSGALARKEAAFRLKSALM